MKKYVSFLLVTAMLSAAFSLCLSFLNYEYNPFEFYDEERKNSIKTAIGAEVEGADQEKESSNEIGYIVKFKEDVSLSKIYNCVTKYDFKLLAESKNRIFKIKLDDIIGFKATFGDMIYCLEEEGTLTLSAAVNDPLAGDQWELDFLEAYSAWDITTGNRNVTVAVLDSGVYRKHPDFEGVTILAGYDAVDRVNVINVDHNGHGTKVVSILAAATDNGQGMAGVGRNISILPIRVSDYTGYIHSADFIEAVYYAADAGVDIINMSFGGYTYSAMEEAAMEYASSKGCLLVSAAGNKETDPQYAGMKAYPASYSSVISVGAVDESGVLCPFSQRNDDVDMVAPGFNVTVANMEDGYEKELGTSFAAAYVSAVASLAFSAIDEGVSFTAEQFVSLVSFLNGGTRDDGYGYGAVNALEILTNINTPLVSGVSNGGVYHKNVAVTFNRGTAVLDGKPFYSGESVITSGSHTLVITDKDNELTISFITDNIPLKYDYKVSSAGAFITFTRGTATLDGAPYLSGSPITAEGKHFFKLTGPYGNTQSFEFECDLKAPQVFGVENGGLYTAPVCITAEKGGTLTLNGKVISSGTVVSKSGGYTLVSANADGSSKSTLYFTLSLNSVTLLNAAVSGSKLISDDVYKTLILYNDALSGIRVFDWGNLNRTKCFIRTESGVIGYGFTSRSLVLIHEEGITVCERSGIASGNTGGVVDYGFKKKAISAFFKDGFVYYVTQSSDSATLYRMNSSDGKSVALTTIDKAIRYLAGDKNNIVAATEDGDILIYSLNGVLLNQTDTAHKITQITAGDGYICTNSFVFGTEKLEKLFALKGNENNVFVKNGVLVTNRSVYDLKVRKPVASFGDTFTDAVITENGYAFKALNGSQMEMINCQGTEFSPSTAAKMLNAAEEKAVSFGAISSLSNYESFAPIPEGINIIDAVLPEKSKDIYAISAAKRTLYRISCENLQVIGQTPLAYEPSSLCSDGKNVYISFKNESLIYNYSISTNRGQYFNCADRYVKLEYADGKVYALNGKGNLYALTAASLAGHAETIIKGQNVIDFACNGGFIYVYLKPVAVGMIYKISPVDFAVSESAVINVNADEIFTAKGTVFAGNKAFDAETLNQIYTLNSPIRFGQGKYVLTDDGLYRSSDGTLLSNCKVDFSTPMFAEDYSYYSVSDDRISKIKNPRNDLDTLPQINGITDGAILDGPISASWGFGVAYLDGEPYTAGTPIENGGMHKFVVSLPFGVTAEVQFTINADINYIVLTAPKTTLRVNESTKLNVTAHPFTYGTVDVVYTTDNDNAVVLPDGSIIGAAAGDCTVTATTADGQHKSMVKFKITEGFIEFDSSYFFADKRERIVKGIGAGTDVEAFLVAASQTKGNLVIRGYGDVTVTAGTIHTGMKAELYDIFGKVIDTWQLSVLGDIDRDGYITANDYYTLNKAVSHPESFTPVFTATADIDSNGTVNAFDLLAMKEHLLGQNDISGTNVAPTRVSNATANVVMPKGLAAGTSFTVSLTLSDMKGVSAISGVLKYNINRITLKDVSVLGKDGGFYTQTSDGIFFFTDTQNTDETAVVLLAVFMVNDGVDVGTDVEVICEDLCIFDGSAAVINGKTGSVKTRAEITKEILIHNLPDYVFDSEIKDNRLTLPSSSQRVYVSAYPMEMSDIAGETSFGNRLTTSFAVVFTDNNGKKSQYNYQCEKSEASPPASGNTDVYKNDNNYLSGLTVNGGVISPVFDKNVTNYYVITSTPEAVTVEAVPESVLSVTTVSEYDPENGVITVSCGAENGSVRLYTLRLCKEPPISYSNAEDNKGELWLWCMPLLALIAGAVTFYLYKKGKKEPSTDE